MIYGMNFEDVLERVGEFGRFQKFIFSLLCIPPIFSGMHTLSYVFTSAVPSHRCYVHGCDTSRTTYLEPWTQFSIPALSSGHGSVEAVVDPCRMFSKVSNSSWPLDQIIIRTDSDNDLEEDDDDIVSTITGSSRSGTSVLYRPMCNAAEFSTNLTQGCSRWKFDNSIYLSTVPSQWQLVCEHEWLVALAETVYMAGIMAGAMIFGNIADQYGRKHTLIVALMLGVTVSFPLPFIPNYALFLVFKFLVAMSFAGAYQTIIILVMELVGKSKRVLCMVLIAVSFALGEILLGVAAYFVRDWRMLQFLISAPAILFFSYYWLIPESPRWLIARKDLEAAEEIISKMALKNKGVVLPPHFRRNPQLGISDLSDVNRHDEYMGRSRQPYSVLDLFRTSALRWLSLNIFLTWIVVTTVYYGISMSIPSVQDDIYGKFIVLSAVELPAYAFCIVALNRLGRRLPLCACMILGGFACISVAFVPDTDDYIWVRFGLCLAGKFGSAAASTIIYVFSAELFPTVVRNIGVGASSMLAHFASCFAPYIASLGAYHQSLPMVVFGICSTVAGLLALGLPETRGRRLPESIADAATFQRNVSCESGVSSMEEQALLADSSVEEELSPWVPELPSYTYKSTRSLSVDSFNSTRSLSTSSR